MRITTPLLLLALAAPLHAQDAKQILARYRAAKPTAEKLAIYRHDWVATLAKAKVRATKQGRPIFFIGNTNISGPTNFYTGHC